MAVVAALGVRGVALGQWKGFGLPVVAAWCGYCAVANVLPVPTVRHISLSMGAPVNVAIAALFPPELAAAIVFVASLSEWEVKRDTTLSHALFNRAQLAAATALASLFFDAYRSVGEPHLTLPPIAVWVAAVVAYVSSNSSFVAVAEWSARGVPVRRVLRGILPTSSEAAVTYLALGLMGVVLALTAVRVGTWAVAVLMLPLLGARHAVNVTNELEKAERERRSLADRLIDERERERVRIASDIHDVVLQQLAALQMQADNIGTALEHDRPDMAVRLAGGLRDGVGGAIGELRGTIASLRRFSMEDGGLAPSLERFARNFRSTTGIDVDVELDERGLGEVPLAVGLLLLECCQEALTNVARHAEATRVEVRAARRGATVELQVRDDGVGFVQDGRAAGFGLPLTGEKVRLSGGLFSLNSRPHEGTTVTVQVPVGATS